MELVCVGLAQNPYITTNQKNEHLTWFEGYFADKVKQIELAVQEEQLLAKDEAQALKKVSTKWIIMFSNVHSCTYRGPIFVASQHLII